MSANANTVLVLGAGASRAETDWQREWGADTEWPAPLDTDCMDLIRAADSRLYTQLEDDLLFPDAHCITTPGMEQLFSDLFAEAIDESRASVHDEDGRGMSSPPPDGLFFDLLRAYQSVLRSATAYATDPRFKGPIQQVIAGLLGTGNGKLSIISFNHDLLAERAIAALREDGVVDPAWGIPGAYSSDIQFREPFHPSPDGSAGDLPQHATADAQPELLKLHGSFNWEIEIPSRYPNLRRADAGEDQSLHLRLSSDIPVPRDSDLSSGEMRSWFMPLVVPPVFEKARWLDRALKGIWDRAAIVLSEADRIVIWGYSLPDADYRAQHLVRRAIRLHGTQTRDPVRVQAIDPSSAIVERVGRIVATPSITWFRDHDAFLRAH